MQAADAELIGGTGKLEIVANIGKFRVGIAQQEQTQHAGIERAAMLEIQPKAGEEPIQRRRTSGDDPSSPQDGYIPRMTHFEHRQECRLLGDRRRRRQIRRGLVGRAVAWRERRTAAHGLPRACKLQIGRLSDCSSPNDHSLESIQPWYEPTSHPPSRFVSAADFAQFSSPAGNPRRLVDGAFPTPLIARHHP